MSVTTVKVSNVSLGASQQVIKEFFSFSGDIVFVEMRSEDERSQVAYVTFKDLQGAETAVLLSGATIVDQSVTVAIDSEYKLPPTAETETKDVGSGSAIQKAEDVVSGMLAKGFILGKDAVNKAKAFDEKHQFTSTASAKVAEMDHKYQVSEKAKLALSAAEQTVSDAGSAIMKNRYVLSGTTWVTGAFNRVTKAAKEKLGEADASNPATEPTKPSSPKGLIL